MRFFIYEVLKYKDKSFIVSPLKHDWWTDCRKCVFKDPCDNRYTNPYFSSDCRGRFFMDA